MAIIGDASRLGGRNREWIFNDSQLQATVQMVSTGSNAILIAKLDRVEKLFSFPGNENNTLRERY